MKAKDTVMNETSIQVWCLEFVQPGELDLNAKLKEFAQAQAEISFPAGQTGERERIADKIEFDMPSITRYKALEYLRNLCRSLKG